MKRVLIVSMLLICLLSGCNNEASGQQITHDPLAYLVMLDQAYNDLMMIENQFRSLEYMYSNVQYQIQSLKKIDFSSYEALRGYTRSRYSGIKGLGSQVRNLQVRIADESYRVGNYLPSKDEINDLFARLYKANLEGDRAEVNRLKKQIDDIKKVNYNARLNVAEEVTGLNKDASEFYEDSLNNLDHLKNEISVSDSVVGQLQLNNELLYQVSLYLERVSWNIEKSAQMAVNNQMLDMLNQYESLEFDAPAPVPLPELSKDFDDYQADKTFMPDFSM